MDPIIGGALIGAGSQMVGMVAGQGMSRRKAGRQFQHNKKIAQYNYDRQMQMYQKQWDDQLAFYQDYQSPKAMMQQYRDAGLNPHLMVGKGGGQMAPTPNATIPQYNQDTNDVGGLDQLPLGDIAQGVISQYVNNKQVESQIRKEKAQSKQEEIKALLMAQGLDDKKAYEKLKAETDFRMDFGDRGPGKLSRYEERAKAQTDFQTLQNAATKVQMALQKATASNLVSNDQLVEMQTKILQAQFDFVNSEWFKKLPGELKAAVMMLQARLGK